MKKNVIICILITLILVLSILVIYLNVFIKSDNTNKYIVITSDKTLTMQNDGGSHYNTYYEIDLDKNIVNKRQDYYKGFDGYKYQGKLIYSKNLTNEDVSELKDLFNKIIESEDLVNEEELESDKRFIYYILKTKNYEEIKIYDNDIINKLEKIVKQ